MRDEQSIFLEAIEQASEQDRAAFLNRACAGNAALRARLEELTAAHERAGGFLESSPPGITLALDAAGGADPRAVLAERPGTTVGRYKLLEQIGEGGMGAVFMAEQTHPVRRRVALKIIKPGMDTKEVIARFEAERQALALMDHPSIAKVFDAGATDAGRPYFAMELVRGIPITEYCDQQQLTPRQRLTLFTQVCRAVQHAHQKGIIHRDLKPNNVLVTVADDGRPVPKVIDFGIAKATTAGQRLTDQTLFTRFQQMIGTPLYMSPEQAEMSAVTDVDTRSDVYSLGVLLYELLTGTTPFDKQRLAKAAYDEVRRILREEEPPRPSTRISTLGETLTSVSTHRRTDPKRLRQTVRGELDWIVMRALEKDRARRYDTANGLARDVERYLADQPVEACPPSRTYRIKKFVRRNKAAMTTTALIAAVLVLATVVSSWQAVRATRAERKAVRAERDAAGARDRAIAARGEATRERDQARAEKRRADEQTEIAMAVTDFLNKDVLGQANVYNQHAPDQLPNPELTVREALDRASSRIPQRFEGRPLVEAEIRDTLGSAYTHLQRFDQAAVHLDAARALRAQVLGEKHLANFENLMERAVLELERGNPIIAEAWVTRALRLAQELGGEGDVRTLSAKSLQGIVFYYQDRTDRAEAAIKHAIDAMGKLLGPEHVNTLRAFRFLAGTYEQRGELDKAEGIARQTLEALRSSVGTEHRQTLLAMEDLARICRGRKDLASAEQFLEEALEHWPTVAGPQSTSALRVTKLLSDIYRERGRHAEAAEAYVQLVDAYPDDHALRYHLATLQLFLGEEEAYRQTCRQLLDRFHDVDDAGVATRTARACLLAPNAVPNFPAVLRLADRTWSPSNSPTFVLTKGMAEYRDGNYDVAVAWLKACYVGFGSLLSAPDPQGLNPGRYSCLEATAAFYLAMTEHQRGRTNQAKEMMAEARARFEKVVPGVGTTIGAVGGVDWYIAHIAAAEAERLLNEQSGSTAPNRHIAHPREAALRFRKSLERQLSRRETDTYPHYHLAATLAYLKDEQAYRAACEDMLRRFADATYPAYATRVARACSVAPNAVADFAPVLRLADRALAKENGPSAFLTKGMAAYRAEDFDVALDCLRQAQTLRGAPGAVAHFFRGMAAHRVGERDEAARSFATARGLFNVVSATSTDSAQVVGDIDLLLAHIAAREAEALMGDAYPATAPATVPATARLP